MERDDDGDGEEGREEAEPRVEEEGDDIYHGPVACQAPCRTTARYHQNRPA